MTTSNGNRNNEKPKEQNKYERDPNLGMKVVDGVKPNNRPNAKSTTVLVNDRKGK